MDDFNIVTALRKALSNHPTATPQRTVALTGVQEELITFAATDTLQIPSGNDFRQMSGLQMPQTNGHLMQGGFVALWFSETPC